MTEGDDASEPNIVVSINPYLRHCCKRCARRGQRRCLPQEMFVKILLHLPAQVVHNVMKHVCREWNLMIRTKDFIQHHLRNSTCGIIIQDFYPDLDDNYEERHRDTVYVEMRRGCLEICKFDSGFQHLLWTSCNGLAVVPDLRDSDIYYVTNPLTKQRAILPPNSSKVRYYSNFGVAFVEASVEYKVVYACIKKPFGQPTKVAVLTIGVDRVWRHIDVGQFSVTDNWRTVPFVTGGYVHWICKTFVLTLNVESETIRWFPMPQFPKLCGKFLPMGCILSFLYKTSEFTRDVWEMNPETGEWTMILSFDLEPLRSIFKNLCCQNVKSLIPFGWLAFREVLLFSTGCMQTTYAAYNVNTREIQSFELGTNLKHYHFQAHVNSLVWLEE